MKDVIKSLGGREPDYLPVYSTEPLQEIELAQSPHPLDYFICEDETIRTKRHGLMNRLHSSVSSFLLYTLSFLPGQMDSIEFIPYHHHTVFELGMISEKHMREALTKRRELYRLRKGIPESERIIEPLRKLIEDGKVIAD